MIGASGYNERMRYLTTKEAMVKLGVTSTSTVKHHLATGRLRGYKRGRDWFIDPRSVREMVEDRRNGGVRPGRKARVNATQSEGPAGGEPDEARRTSE